VPFDLFNLSRSSEKPFSKEDGWLHERDEAVFFYRAHYVLAVAREACSESLEPHERDKYAEAMMYLRDAFECRMKARMDKVQLDTEAIHGYYRAWIKVLKLPDDDVSFLLAARASDYLGSLEAQGWQVVVQWGLLEHMKLRAPDMNFNQLTDDERLEFLGPLLHSPNQNEPMAASGEVKPNQRRLPRVTRNALGRFFNECFKQVGTHPVQRQGRSPSGFVPIAAIPGPLEQWQAESEGREPIQPTWIEQMPVFELQPPVYVAGQPRDEYLTVVEAYMAAVEFVADKRNATIQGQNRENLERDMRWLAWAAIEHLNGQKIANREDPKGHNDANRSKVHAALFENNGKPGLAVLAQVQI
jgi:hypothetical protein